MNAPKKPVQPWIPAQVTRIPRQELGQRAVVHVVHHHRSDPLQAKGPLRAGWIFALITGLLLGLGVGMLSGGGKGGWEVLGGVFFGLGYYLLIFAELVVVVLAIIAMARGAALRGILLLVGAPVLMLGIGLTGALLGGVARHGIVIKKEVPVERIQEPELPAKAEPSKAESALRVTEIIEDAEKLLKVRDEEVFQGARSEAFRRAAGADVLEEHREALRSRLRAMFEAAEIERSRRIKPPR